MSATVKVALLVVAVVMATVLPTAALIGVLVTAAVVGSAVWVGARAESVCSLSDEPWKDWDGEDPEF